MSIAASIIITVYEQPASLRLLLSSLAFQSCSEPFEVFICDDGSSPKVFDLIAKMDDRLNLRYIWHPKIGHRASRSKNNGIRCARGRYLIFVDADIVVKRDFVERHLSAHTQPRQVICNPRRWLLSTTADAMIGKIWEDAGSRPSNLRYEDLIRELEVSTDHLDRFYQRHFAESDMPWMSCIGYSLSVERNPEVYFDECFEGWGPEDRELALRLTARHGYSVTFRDDIEVYHLERYSTGRTPFLPIPTEKAQIILYLKNMIYFSTLYPNHDLTICLLPIICYELNSDKSSWLASRHPPSLTRLDDGVRSAVKRKMLEVQGWLKEKNLLSR